MASGTFRSLPRQEKKCLVCGKVLQDEEKVYQISEGVIQSMTPTFLPTSSLGFIDQSCFEDLLNQVNETLVAKKSALPPLFDKR